MLNIAIFMPYMGLYDNTKIIWLARELAGRGGHVDLHVLNSSLYETAPESPLHPRISIHDLGKGECYLKDDRKTFSDFIPDSAVELLDELIQKQVYDYTIGVDADGMLLANHYHERTGCPFAYLSRKLFRVGWPGYVWSNLEMERLKAFERDIIPKADLFIIQDFQREESFFENLGIRRHPRILHFPSSVADSRLSGEADYWHEMFDLSPYTRVMLSVGRFTTHNLKSDLLEAYGLVSQNLVWVLHGSFDDAVRELVQPYVDKGTILLSEKQVKWQSVPKLFASADIGLGCFYEFDINQYLAARASSSMAYFAKAGVPVIMPNFSTFQEVVLMYRNGLTLPTPNKLPGAISTIISHYSVFATGAREAFEDLYDMRLYCEQLWEHVRDIKNRRFVGIYRNDDNLLPNVDPPVSEGSDEDRLDKYNVEQLLKGLPV
jgi:glycosyltransferase involved in cell wall biosynthesis